MRDGAAVCVGVGMASSATADEVRTLVDSVLAAAGTGASASVVATIDRLAGDPRVTALGLSVRGWDAAELGAVGGTTARSARSLAATGTPSVAEAAALRSAGPGSRLVVARRSSAHATAAVAVPGVRVVVVGIGMGEAAQLTGEAVDAIRSLDVVLTLDKGAPRDLGAARRALCEAVRGGDPVRVVDAPDPPRDRSAPVAASTAAYEGAVDDWTAARARVYAELLRRELPDGGVAGLLAWGDPAFYDSTLRVLDAVPLDLDVTVVPGISSLQVLAAAHRIPLTRVGRPLLVTTGRRLADDGVPDGVEDVAVMLDGRAAYASLDPAGWEIWWGAHLGSADQVLVSGPLASAADGVAAARSAARARRGWVMDTYLLRRALVEER